MRPTVTAALLLLATSVFTPASASLAQRTQRLVSIGVGGGASMPLGASGDQLIFGFHGLGTLAVGRPTFPVGLRVDLAYDQFQFERALLGAAGPPGAARVLSFSVNPTFELPANGTLVTPYFLGGVGSYSQGCTESSSACHSSTNFGWNLGGGAKFQLFGLRAFAEARYHRTAESSLSTQYLPITLGLLF
jgi:opacity protein-like surface antigen